MFGVYFGDYLVGKGILTKDKLNQLLHEGKNTRVKMGLLAVESNYMTTAQADEVNMLQQMQDKRFGDIAIEKGYLTEDQVEDLLEKQGDDYLIFVQALIENHILELASIQEEMNAFKKQERFSAKDIDALKSGDIDRITPIFLKDEAIPELVKDYVSLTARNVVRFIDSAFRMDKVEMIDAVKSDYIAAQELVGDHRILAGFVGNGHGIRMIAQEYAKEYFDTIDIDVLDAACEFLNCNNGLFATSACNSGMDLDMMPPIMKEESVVIENAGTIYKVPLYVKGEAVELILIVDTEVSIA